jgi:hypothetical protein
MGETLVSGDSWVVIDLPENLRPNTKRVRSKKGFNRRNWQRAQLPKRGRGRPSGKFNKNKNILLVLLRRVCKRYWYEGTDKYLAEKMKVSTRQIQRYMKALEAERQIFRERQKWFISNEVRFTTLRKLTTWQSYAPIRELNEKLKIMNKRSWEYSEKEIGDVVSQLYSLNHKLKDTVDWCKMEHYWGKKWDYANVQRVRLSNPSNNGAFEPYGTSRLWERANPNDFFYDALNYQREHSECTRSRKLRQNS